MMVQADARGAMPPESVAAAHSVRVMLVVVTIPFLYRALDLHGSDLYQPVVVDVRFGGLLALLALTLAAALLAERLRSPNAFG